MVAEMKPKHQDEKFLVEFGGPVGTFGLIVWSHCLMLYFWISLEYY